jgi:hypothetical protein
MRALESDQNRRDTSATPMTMAVSKATFQNSFEADMSGSPPKAWFVLIEPSEVMMRLPT